MNPKDLKDWVEFAGVIVAWVVAAAVLWTKQNNKINGLGGRVKKVEGTCEASAARITRVEQELADYRRDMMEANSRLGRVEKAVEDVGEEVRNGNIALGTQLHGIEKLINETDKKNSNRLVRLETIGQVEKKVGPIPTGD